MIRQLRSIAAAAAVVLVSASLLVACGGATGSTAQPSAEPPIGMFTAHDECADDATGASVCDRTATDQRMTGKARISPATTSGEPSESLGILAGRFDLSNGGGEWACREFIIGHDNGVGMRDQVCIGKGGYEGLVAYTHSTTPDTTATWGVLGWIEESQ